ncbi:MAG: type IV pilus inner membrane component PilO [Planctomycetota bacterium]
MIRLTRQGGGFMSGNLKKIIFFILLLGVACLAYQCMIKPTNKQLAEQSSRVQEKLAKLSEFEKATSAAESLNLQLRQLAEAVEFFESRLPPKSDIATVLEQVTTIAQGLGLKPKTIRTLRRKDNSGYIEQPLEMELVGKFNSFYSFLLELEKLPRIIKVRQLNLELKWESDYVGIFERTCGEFAGRQ